MAKRKAAKKRTVTDVDADAQHDRLVMRLFRVKADRERKIRTLARTLIRERKKTVATLRELGEFAIAEANHRAPRAEEA